MSALSVVQSVVKLARENADLLKEVTKYDKTLTKYESWFDSLVGRRGTIKYRKGRRTVFVDGTVSFFSGFEWELTPDDGSEARFFNFQDITDGYFWVIHA